MGNAETVLARVKSAGESLFGQQMRARFGAWWRGDVLALRERRLEVPAAPHPQPALSETPASPPAVSAEDILRIRIAVSEQLWGQGNLGPGDADFVTELCSQLRLNKEKSVAFLGAGLGGAARAIVAETDVWVTGFEANAIVAAAGVEQNTLAGKAKKVTIAVADFETLSLPKKKFNDVISKEALYLVQNKARLIKDIAESIKPGGTFLFTDFVEPQHPLSNGEREALFCAQWGVPQLVSPAAYSKMIEDAGLDLRVNADITQSFADIVTAGWANLRRLLDHMAGQEDDPARRAVLLRVVAEEAAIWANRLEAFREGRLALHRVVALKPQ